MTTFNSTEIKKFAKEAGIKNWWKKKTAELRTELQAHHKVTNDAELDFILKGGCIKELPTFSDPRLEIPRESSAGDKIDPEKEAKREQEKKERRRKPRKVNSKPAKDSKTPKAQNGISLKTLCEELNIEPRVARRKLRNSDLEKPTSGWEWDKDDTDTIKQVKLILKHGGKNVTELPDGKVMVETEAPKKFKGKTK